MSESRILLLDNDAVRAEHTVALLEFMDFNPRWVADAADFSTSRYRQNDWMAVIVGELDDSDASTALFQWLAQSSLPPPVLFCRCTMQTWPRAERAGCSSVMRAQPHATNVARAACADHADQWHTHPSARSHSCWATASGCGGTPAPLTAGA